MRSADYATKESLRLGLGVDRIEPVELLGLADTKPDGTLLAGRYTLLDQARCSV